MMLSADPAAVGPADEHAQPKQRGAEPLVK